MPLGEALVREGFFRLEGVGHQRLVQIIVEVEREERLSVRRRIDIGSIAQGRSGDHVAVTYSTSGLDE